MRVRSIELEAEPPAAPDEPDTQTEVPHTDDAEQVVTSLPTTPSAGRSAATAGGPAA